MADIKDLYSSDLKEAINKDMLCDRNGTMIINTLIGTSIIRAHKLKGPSGPLLIIDYELENELKEASINYKIQNEYAECLQINWLNFKNSYLDKVLNCYNNINKNINDKELLKSYIAKNKSLTGEWKKNAEKLLED